MKRMYIVHVTASFYVLLCLLSNLLLRCSTSAPTMDKEGWGPTVYCVLMVPSSTRYKVTWRTTLQLRLVLRRSISLTFVIVYFYPQNVCQLFRTLYISLKSFYSGELYLRLVVQIWLLDSWGTLRTQRSERSCSCCCRPSCSRWVTAVIVQAAEAAVLL